MRQVSGWYEEYGPYALFIAGVSPIPFKVFTVTSGFFFREISLFPFILICTVSRGGRFMLEALLLRLFGRRIQDELEKRFNFWSVVFLALLVGGFVLLKWRPWER